MASPATLSTGDDQRFHGGPFAAASQAVPYSPLATPSRSSMRPKEGTARRAGSVAASVRFSSSVRYQEIAADPTDHTDGVGPMRGRSPQGVKKNIFKKYFDEFNTYALMVSPVSPSRAPPAFRSGGGGSVASGPATPTSRRSLGGGAGAGLIVRAGSISQGGGGGGGGGWDMPWTPISAAGVSTTHVPSEWDSPRPRWAVGRRKGAAAGGGGAEPGEGPLHAATRPVTCGGPLPGHVSALDELLAKSWSRAEVEAAQSWGFFRRLVPHLGVPPLQAPAALLLGRCARLQPALLPPLTTELCGALPGLVASPRLDVRQASLCLLGLLWRATATGDSHARTQLLGSSALLTALTARIAEGDFDALFAAREVASDPRGAVALEKAGALRALCGVLRRLLVAARAAAGEAEGEGAAGTDGEEEAGGTAAVAHAGGHAKSPAKSPGAKSPGAKSPGKKQLALAGSGKGPGGGVRVPPGLTGRSPSPGKKAVVVSVEGVTEGGEETERAAAGVLVADCLAALTAALPAASAMVRRYRVPERLVALLLTCRVEPDPEPQEQLDKDQQQGKQEGDTDRGTDQDKGTEQGSAAAAGGGDAAAGAAAAAGGQQGEKKAASESGSDIDIEKILNEDSSEEKRDQESANDRAKKEGSGGGAAAAEAAATAAVNGETAAGGDASKAGDADKEEEPKTEEGDEAAKRLSERRRRQLQLQEALLRCLHTLAGCGMGKEPQEAVQSSLRDAGAPAMERLARVLQERHTLAGCGSAAYLLWLAAAGDYSATPASELNVLRSRLAAEAPEKAEDRSSSSGFGVVGAVRELLLRHVAVAAVASGGGAGDSTGGGGGGWRDEDVGDAVAEVGTAVPPPPPAPPPAAAALGTPRGGGGFRLGGGSSGSGGESEGLRRSMGPGAGGAAPSLHTDSLPRPQDLAPGDSPFASGGAANSGGGGAGAGSGGGGAGRDVTGPSLGLPTLRVASAGLLLTPRESRPGSGGHMISPQRYAAGSSDEEDEEGGGGRRRAPAFAGGGGSGSVDGDGDDRDGGSSRGGGRGGGGGGSASTPPEDLDMSNIIDSSVELTGKEYIMQAIQAAGALAVQEMGGFPGPGPSPDPDPRVSGGAGTIAPSPSPGEPFPPAGVLGGVPGMGARGGRGGAGAEAHSSGGHRSTEDHVGCGRDGLPAAPGSGSTPVGAPRSSRTPDSHQLQHHQHQQQLMLQLQQQQHDPRHVGWAPDGGRLNALRPAALELALAASSPAGAGGAAAAGAYAAAAPGWEGGRGSAKRIPLLTLKTRLGALRAVRRQRRPLRPPPAEFQELLHNCFGLLSAVALSAAGCRAICEAPRPAAGEASGDGVGGILPFASALLETAADAPESLAAAAVSGSSMDLRLQLFALMGNVALHSDGVAALTSEAAGAPPGLVAALFAAARESLALVGSSPTGWREGQRLLEACFTVLTNLHRGRAALSPPPDPATGKPQEAYGLALRALAMQLPGAMGPVDRARVRAAAARMLDSAVAAYEGVGGSAPPVVAEELVVLVAAGGGIATAAAAAPGDCSSSTSGSAGAGARAFGAGAGKDDASGGGVGGPRVTEAAERAACDAAAALWQLMAAGQVHPDAVAADLTPALSAILCRTDASAALSKAALGLVSCLTRSPLVGRRLWTSPLVPAVMKAHARARKAGEGEVEEAARGVCQQLLRACHREDRGGVSAVDKRVDRWGLTERMLRQLKCRLEWDGGEEAIMLVDWDAD